MKTATLNGRHLAKVVPAGLCSGPVLMLRGRRDNGAGPVVMLNRGVLSLVGSRRNFCDLKANFIFKYDIMDLVSSPVPIRGKRGQLLRYLVLPPATFALGNYVLCRPLLYQWAPPTYILKNSRNDGKIQRK